jgi:hypothetical protein
MALNKKSLVQIVVLVVLVAAAGGAYLMQQEGGLDFITSLLGDKASAPVAKAPEKKGVAEDMAKAAERKARTEVPAIPAGPVKGQVHGRPFTLERAFIDRGVLVLLSGKDPVDAGVGIQLPAKPWEVPAGKNFKFLNASGADVPRVRLSWKEDDKGGLGHQDFTDKYTLVLELGPEKDNRISGKLHLALPDEPKSLIAGTFEAEIKGFRIVNGKPDLASDSVETLEYLALQEMLKGDPDKAVQTYAFRGQRIADSSIEKTPTGYLELEYRVGEAAPVIQRYQFLKEKGEWRVWRTLKLTEIDEAHPPQVPGAKADPAKLFPYLAAKRLETELARKSPKKGIFATEFAVRANDKHKLGQAEVSYQLEGAAQPTKIVYLLRLKPAGWALDRELSAKEKVNFDTGKIEVAKAGKK